MFLALLLVAMLIYLVEQSDENKANVYSQAGLWWLIGCMAVLLVQISLGTQVREAIDRVAGIVPREQWISSILNEFVLHRSFSWVVLFLHVGLILKLRKTTGLKAFSQALILLILGTILTGVGMAYFAVPAYLQPLHLLLATVSFGLQFLILLKVSRREKTVLVNQ